MGSTIRTDYVSASIERLEESRFLVDQGAYTGAIYLSGLAAESMIKAFITRKGDEIKGHNLSTLAIHANLARRLKPRIRGQVNAAISEAAPMWKNLYRYCSESDLDRMALEFRLRFQVGNRVVLYASLNDARMEQWAKRLYNLASLIVQEGDLLWQSQRS